MTVLALTWPEAIFASSVVWATACLAFLLILVRVSRAAEKKDHNR